jgi:hypothetical protein
MNTRPLLVGTLLALGCADKDNPSPTESTDSATPDEAPYLLDETAITPPATTASTITAIIETGLNTALALETEAVFNAYITASAGMDDDCPLWATNGDSPYWYSTCTSADGTQFDGYGTLIDYVDFVDGDGTVYNGTQLYTFSTISTPDGTSFHGSGVVSELTGLTADGATYTYRELNGDFTWGGPEAAGTWLASDLSPALSVQSWMNPSNGQGANIIDGAISGLDAGAAVVFEAVNATTGMPSSDCIPEPLGALSVLDTDGNWFDLQFGGTSTGDAFSDEETCDGCAQAWYQGVNMGSVCPDFEPLWAWPLD